jgi:predicted MFS family arabinose efflux permease
MGFANLWVLPLRVDYLTSSAYGIEGSALFVATLITIIPDFMRAFSAPLLAKLFDRINFVVLRMILNVIFALGVGLFFLTKDPYIFGLAAALIGIAFGGGTVAWGLWVTKYAPPGKVGAYMSVHVFLTGIRGTLGPLIGFWTVQHIGPSAIGMVSFAMMITATLMLIPEIKHGRGKHIPSSQIIS